MGRWNNLLYLSGNDIPFAAAAINIHPPRIKDIAIIGEENFYSGVEFLKFDKDILSEEDKIHLENKSNFEVLIAIMNEQNITIQKQRTQIEMVLALLFPDYVVEIKPTYISFIHNGEENKIDNTNYEEFKKILKHMFCLDSDREDGSEYNPAGDMAKRIADKLKRRHQRIAQTQEGENKISILEKYVSILAVGEQKDMNSLLNYTVYQLFDELKRYQLKLSWDIHLKAQLAGAQNLQEVEDWMKDIHP